MTTIESGKGIITQINVFTVRPENVDPLMQILEEAANRVKDKNGWLSINLHVSLDRTRVTNYAQCSSKEAWDGIMEQLYAEGFIDRLLCSRVARPSLVSGCLDPESIASFHALSCTGQAEIVRRIQPQGVQISVNNERA